MQVLEAVDPAALDELSARDEFFWLDVVSPSPRVLLRRLHGRGVLRGSLRRRRGSAGTRSCARELEAVHARFRRRPADSEHFAAYAVMDALTDSFFPVLDSIDDEIDRLEEAIVRRPGDRELAQVFRLKRLIVELRRVVGPQRDLAARALDDLTALPGLEVAERDYFRDLYDHLLRIAERLDAYRDLLTSAMDVYLSTVSNRLNGVMKQLTLIATIFLPLTFMTGFFGQNFGWLTDHVSSLGAFLGYGVGGYALAVAALFTYFKRRGFFD